MMHACSTSECPLPGGLPPAPPVLVPAPGRATVPAARPATRFGAAVNRPGVTPRQVVAAVDPDDEDEDLGDEEDLVVSQPAADDESSFEDFDDEFDDDFEEEENDPDWDHPDDGDAEPPPGKPPGRKK